MFKKTSFLLLTILFTVTQVHAGAVIERRKRMAQQQKAAVARRRAELQKQAVLEQQARAQALARRKQQQQMQAYQRQRAYGARAQSNPVVKNETLELYQIWEFFEEKSGLWAYMIDTAPKIKTVERFIKIYRDNGIYIYKNASGYVRLIDEMTQGNSALLNSPFADVLKFVAIMEYDFDNGKNKDMMARHLLGEKVYQENKRRLGMQ